MLTLFATAIGVLVAARVAIELAAPDEAHTTEFNHRLMTLQSKVRARGLDAFNYYDSSKDSSEASTMYFASLQAKLDNLDYQASKCLADIEARMALKPNVQHVRKAFKGLYLIHDSTRSNQV